MTDLRSDTVTLPTEEMRAKMATAPVGDDVYEDDPTIKELEALSARVLGKEAGLFVPSGTMGNQLAIMTYTNKGDEIILGYNSHIAAHEVGGVALLSGANYRLINNPDDILYREDVENAIRTEDIHEPVTALICLENALANGTVVPLKEMEDVYRLSRERNIPIHLDGARIFNAAVYLGVEPEEIAKYCDTVMFCVSKGLAAPIGSLLCGSHDIIKKARKYRKLLGGGMRQGGIIAAAGIIAVEKMTKRLHTDHENALYLAKELSQFPDVETDIDKVHINMVFFKLKNTNHEDFLKYMLNNQIKLNPPEKDIYRFVTHNNITKEQINRLISLMKEYVST